MVEPEILQKYLDQLKCDMPEEHWREFEVAFSQALLTGKHFINDEHCGLHLELEHPMPAEEIVNTFLEWEFTPQGAPYWERIFERLCMRSILPLEESNGVPH